MIKVPSISSLVLQVSAKNLFSLLKVWGFLEKKADYKSEVSQKTRILNVVGVPEC